MMRLTAAVLIALATPALAQALDAPEVAIPKLAQTASTADAFTPEGWMIEARAEGDLDGDGRPDLALVLHDADRKNVLKNENGLGGDMIDTNPRILAVAVATTGGGYRLAVQNATLIPRHVEPNMDDPFEPDGLTIARGALQVVLSSFASSGGWEQAQPTFSFHLKNGVLRLIGYDNATVRRNTGEMTTTSVNYLSGRMSHATGTISSDKEKIRWSKAPTRIGPTIDEIGDGLAFDPGR